MSLTEVPKTLALIPDGNRRWASQRKLPILNGYNVGIKKFIDFSEWCINYGIDSITVWAFSTENLTRNRREVNTLFRLYKLAANDKEITNILHNNEARFKVIGNRALLPKDLLSSLHQIEIDTKMYSKRVLNMLVGYGGRDDIMYAVKSFARHVVKYGASAINESVFRNYLISNTVPDIDLIIRTSGERRLSGFIPWQSAYSELYFSKKLWPDFTKKDLHYALTDYNNRQRRFGR